MQPCPCNTIKLFSCISWNLQGRTTWSWNRFLAWSWSRTRKLYPWDLRCRRLSLVYLHRRTRVARSRQARTLRALWRNRFRCWPRPHLRRTYRDCSRNNGGTYDWGTSFCLRSTCHTLLCYQTFLQWGTGSGSCTHRVDFRSPPEWDGLLFVWWFCRWRPKEVHLCPLLHWSSAAEGEVWNLYGFLGFLSWGYWSFRLFWCRWGRRRGEGASKELLQCRILLTGRSCKSLILSPNCHRSTKHILKGLSPTCCFCSRGTSGVANRWAIQGHLLQPSGRACPGRGGPGYERCA